MSGAGTRARPLGTSYLPAPLEPEAAPEPLVPVEPLELLAPPDLAPEAPLPFEAVESVPDPAGAAGFSALAASV